MRLIKKQAARQAALDATYPVDHSSLQQWQFIQSYLRASNVNDSAQHDLDLAMSVLPPELVLISYSDLIRTTFRMKIVPALQQVVPTPENFAGIVQNLSDGLVRYESCFARLKVDVGDITAPFQALVSAQLDESVWRGSIRKWLCQVLAADEDELLLQMSKKVSRIGLGPMFERELVSLLGSSLLDSLNERYAKEWEETQLESVLDTSTSRPHRILQDLHLGGDLNQLQDLARAGLANLRISELFDIIVDYPTSIPALEDLKQCLKSTATRAKLVSDFGSQCQSRLLHPGANTPDIITIYISAIKALLLLDPPGVLLDKIARPIRRYLRERTDTIRCIISSLLGEVDSPLSLELVSEVPPDDPADDDDPDWEPDPIDAAPDYAKNRASDIIGSLISIYENKEIFVRELQTFLSDRLLAITDYNIDHELRNLELLKVRFGDGMLAVCDVMLKDLADSRRIDKEVHDPNKSVDSEQISDTATPLDSNVIHATIVSRLYWPTLKSKQFTPNFAVLGDNDDDDEPSKPTEIETKGVLLPPDIQTMMKTYASRYTALKPQRGLSYCMDLGHVRVLLELEDRQFDMMVTPAHASSIKLFDDKVNQISLTTVMTILGLSASEARVNLGFWVHQGILSVSNHEDGTELYSVQETAVESTVSTTAATTMMTEQIQVMEEEEEASSVDDDMSVFWNFIVGMLTNVGSLEIDRIHSMLGMFAPNYDRTVTQLASFMGTRMREGLVEMKGGMYKLSNTS